MEGSGNASVNVGEMISSLQPGGGYASLEEPIDGETQGEILFTLKATETCT